MRDCLACDVAEKLKYVVWGRCVSITVPHTCNKPTDAEDLRKLEAEPHYDRPDPNDTLENCTCLNSPGRCELYGH